MRKILTLLAASSALLAGCGSSTAPEAELYAGTDNFSRPSLVRYTSYSDEPANDPWQIVSGELRGTGPGAHALLIRDVVTILDGWVETTTRHIDDGGLVMRFQNSSNYYLLAIRDDSSPAPRASQNLKLYRRLNGDFTEMVSVDLPWPRGTDRVVRLEASGGTFRIYADAQLVGTANDPAPLGQGRVGLRHYGDNVGWESRYQSFSWFKAD